jgi:dTMP kinase
MSYVPYVIFEGNDGSGKTTVMRAVAERMQKARPALPIKETQHPGSTPLGRHIRQLVKFPQSISADIQIDDLSRQMLYMVDTVNFIKTILIPSLTAGTAVFADRSSFISALIYGRADGLKLEEIARLFDVITPPRADRLYILQCPADITTQRKKERIELDHYDQKSTAFIEKIEKSYGELLTASAEQTILISRTISLSNVIYIDASAPLEEVVTRITNDLCQLLDEKAN